MHRKKNETPRYARDRTGKDEDVDVATAGSRAGKEKGAGSGILGSRNENPKKRSEKVNQARPENLELGRSLRESNSLINCRAVVEFNNGDPGQYFHAVIPSNRINADGYVEEVWIDAQTIETCDFYGETHSLIYPLNRSIFIGDAWIDSFELSPQQYRLRPSSNMLVKIRINPS